MVESSEVRAEGGMGMQENDPETHISQAEPELSVDAEDEPDFSAESDDNILDYDSYDDVFEGEPSCQVPEKSLIPLTGHSPLITDQEDDLEIISESRIVDEVEGGVENVERLSELIVTGQTEHISPFYTLGSHRVATSATESHVLGFGIEQVTVDPAVQAQSPPRHSGSPLELVSIMHGVLPHTLSVSHLETPDIETESVPLPLSTSLHALCLEPQIHIPLFRTQESIARLRGCLIVSD